MSRQPFSNLGPAFAGLILALSLIASGTAAFCAEERPLGAKGPVTVTASTLTADNKAHNALFEGSVIARTDTMTMYSDRMLVYYSEGNKVTKIEAEGNVKVVSGERVITARAATYFTDPEKVIFTGDPKAVEGSNMVTGTRMTYFIKEDRSIVENSRVFMEKDAGKNR